MTDTPATLRLERFCFKLYAREPHGVALHDFVPVFHRWIQTKRMEGLLIDVADYAHVPEGPGVVLIGHEADYFMDQSEGPLGLLYNRKRLAQGSGFERLRHGLACCLAACIALEQEPTLGERGLRFDGSRVRFIVNDRLSAPNDDRTLAAIRPDLETLLARVWAGQSPEIAREARDHRGRFTVEARVGAAPALPSLLQLLAV